MKLDDETTTKGLSSLACFIIAIFLIVGWTYFVNSGIIHTILDWLKGGV